MNGGAEWHDYAAFAVALVVAIGGLIKFIVGRTDRLRDEVSKNLDARTKERVDATAELHDRIDEVKDTYVRRDDLTSALGPIGLAHAEVMNELRQLRERMHEVAGAVAGIQGRLASVGRRQGETST